MSLTESEVRRKFAVVKQRAEELQDIANRLRILATENSLNVLQLEPWIQDQAAKPPKPGKGS